MSKVLTCDGCGAKKSPLKKEGGEWLCFACIKFLEEHAAKIDVEIGEGK